jgi:hypothetical protein
LDSWRALLDAIVRLLEALRVPLGLFGAFKSGQSVERTRNKLESSEEGKEVLRRALSVPAPDSVPNDALDAELQRRDLLRVAGVKAHRDK